MAATSHSDEIKKVYYTSKEVAEALGWSITKVNTVANEIGIRYRGNRKKRKFTDYDLNRLNNEKKLC